MSATRPAAWYRSVASISSAVGIPAWAAASTGGVPAAARLGLPQSAVSNKVSRIERALGVRLFDRSVRGVVVTSAGHRLLLHANGIVAAMKAMVEDVRPATPGRAATVSCYSPLVGDLVSALAAVEGVEWLVEEFHYGMSPQRVRENRLDVVVGYSLPSAPVPVPADDRWRVFAREQIAVAVGVSHPLAGARDVDLEDLRDETWAARCEGPLRELLTHSCRDNGFAPRIRYSLADNSSIACAIMDGRAISLSAPVSRRKGIRIVPLRDGPCRELYAACSPASFSRDDSTRILDTVEDWYRRTCGQS